MRLKVKKRHAISELPDGTVGILCIRTPKNQKGVKNMILPEYILSLYVDIKEAIYAYDEEDNNKLVISLRYIIDKASKALTLVGKDLSKINEQNTDS